MDNSIINRDSSEKIKKSEEYMNYIKDHINNVHKSYKILFEPLLSQDNISSKIGSDDAIKNAIMSCVDAIEHHDDSKFDDVEFEPYRAKYYPTTDELNASDEEKAIIDERYRAAWIHHYKNNSHHPDHWYNSELGKYNDMTLGAIIHMICDWYSMSLYYNSSIVDWYNNQAITEKKAMSEYTRNRVDEFFKILF